MNTTAKILATLTVAAWMAAALTACGAGNEQVRASEVASEPAGRLAPAVGAAGEEACPLQVEETEAHFDDLGYDVAIRFTTDEYAAVPRLRELVRELAGDHNRAQTAQAIRAAREAERGGGAEDVPYGSPTPPGLSDERYGRTADDEVRPEDVTHSKSDVEALHPWSGEEEERAAHEARGGTVGAARSPRGFREGRPIASRAIVEDVADGARLRFVAMDPGHREALRRQVTRIVDELQRSDNCAALEAVGGDQTSEPVRFDDENLEGDIDGRGAP